MRKYVKYKLHYLIVLSISIIAQSSSASWAQSSSTIDCPTIPKGITTLTVKSSKATIRTEPKYGTSNKGPSINKNDKLTVISSSPQTGPDQTGTMLCWYQVKPVQENNSSQSYWIAEIGFKEFSSFKLPQTSYQDDIASSAKYNQTEINNRKSLFSWQLWLIVALFLSIIGNIIAIGAFIFSYHSHLEQNEKLKKIIQLIPVSDLEITNLENFDLAILAYFKKHEKANFIDLLSNLQCNEQLLHDRLLALEKEEFIEIIEQSDKNNPIYRMC